MDSVRYDGERRGHRVPIALKILVAGGFGAGKTTLVSAVSEVRPLQTEEILTDAGIGTDDISGVESKSTTTVAMDFGRITINDDLQLYLFGTPGQDRFWFLWDELAFGALGAVVLADTRRLADCFPSIDYFEQRGIPFVVAVNCFDDDRRFSLRGGTQGPGPGPGRADGALRRPGPAVRQDRTDLPGRARRPAAGRAGVDSLIRPEGRSRLVGLTRRCRGKAVGGNRGSGAEGGNLWQRET